MKYFLILLLAFLSCHNHSQYEAPDFTLPDVYGNRVRLYDHLDHGPVVIITWALWCKMCIKEVDAICPYSEELRSEMGIYIFAISQDRIGREKEVHDFSIDRHWIPNCLVLIDTARIIMDLYDIQAMPTLIAIGQNGDIAYRREGYMPGYEVEIIDTLKTLFGE